MTEIINNNRKRVSISPKRQITIPQSFFSALGFDKEAEFIFKENELVLRPISSNYSDDFSEQILAELIKEGYSGESMLKEFKVRQLKVKNSIKLMMKEADEVSIGKTEYMTMGDVFKG